MFFLLRAAFWMGLVFLLLPADRSEKPPVGGEGSTTTSEAIAAARSTLEGLEGFCDRHAVACDGGRATLEDFGARAVEGFVRARARSELGLAGAAPVQATPKAPVVPPATTDVARAPRGATVPMPQPRPIS